MSTMMQLTGGVSTYNSLMAIARRAEARRRGVPTLAQATTDHLKAITDPRKTTSGGPRDRARHLAYQRTYQATRTRFGVNVKKHDGGPADAWVETWYYSTRKEANLVRRTVAAGLVAGYVLKARRAVVTH